MNDQLQQLTDTLAVASDIVEACEAMVIKADIPNLWLDVNIINVHIKDVLSKLKAAGYMPTGQQQTVTA